MLKQLQTVCEQNQLLRQRLIEVKANAVVLAVGVEYAVQIEAGDPETGLAWPSMRRYAEAIGRDQKTVSEGISTAMRLGHVTSDPRRFWRTARKVPHTHIDYVGLYS